MRRETVFLVVVGTVSMVGWLGCGGSTTGTFMNEGNEAGVDAGSTTSGAGGDGGAGGSSGGTGGDNSEAGLPGGGGGGPFDPGGIGTLIGGGKDGGAADGGPAGTGPIRPEVVDGCDALCVKEATAKCPNQDTVTSCVLGCRLILNNASCAAQSSALFDCEKTSTVACNAQGKATLAQCPAQEVAAAACFLQSSVDPSVTAPCGSYCAGVAGAHCPNDDVAGCQGSCQIVGHLAPACNDAWKSYITCASGAMFTCGNDGKAGAPACGLQFATFALCLYGGALNTGDAGR